MKRGVILLIVLLLASFSVYAEYKIALTDGTVITADEKPVIKGDFAYFSKDGLFLFIAKSRVDFAKTDEVNMKAELKEEIILDKPTDAATPVAVKPVFIDDAQLEIIRQRSRLANEGEFPPPKPLEEGEEGAEGQDQYAPSAQPAGQEGSGDGQSPREQLNERLSGLLNQRAGVQSQRDQLQAQLRDLNDRFGFSVQGDEKASLQSEIDAVTLQIGDLNGQLDTINNDLLNTQSQIASTPMTVEVR
jgi:hypothetical protein